MFSDSVPLHVTKQSVCDVVLWTSLRGGTLVTVLVDKLHDLLHIC